MPTSWPRQRRRSTWRSPTGWCRKVRGTLWRAWPTSTCIGARRVAMVGWWWSRPWSGKGVSPKYWQLHRPMQSTAARHRGSRHEAHRRWHTHKLRITAPKGRGWVTPLVLQARVVAHQRAAHAQALPYRPARRRKRDVLGVIMAEMKGREESIPYRKSHAAARGGDSFQHGSSAAINIASIAGAWWCGR